MTPDGSAPADAAGQPRKMNVIRVRYSIFWRTRCQFLLT